MWRHVDLVWTNVSEEHIASILRVAQSAATCSRWFLGRGFFHPEDGDHTFLRNVGSQLSLQPPAHAGSSLTEFSTLNIEAIHSSETSVHTRSIRLSAATCSRLRIFLPWRWSDTLLRNVGSHDLYGATSQKTAFFNVILNFHNRYISALEVLCRLYATSFTVLSSYSSIGLYMFRLNWPSPGAQVHFEWRKPT
jgi:hypothetical protein